MRCGCCHVRSITKHTYTCTVRPGSTSNLAVLILDAAACYSNPPACLLEPPICIYLMVKQPKPTWRHPNFAPDCNQSRPIKKVCSFNVCAGSTVGASQTAMNGSRIGIPLSRPSHTVRCCVGRKEGSIWEGPHQEVRKQRSKQQLKVQCLVQHGTKQLTSSSSSSNAVSVWRYVYEFASTRLLLTIQSIQQLGYEVTKTLRNLIFCQVEAYVKH
jgi:hypothetical protein